MRIVNNKIYIKKGETPVYSSAVIIKETGAPLVITQDFYSEGVQDLLVEFVVRPSAYSREEDFNIKRYLLIENPHIFDDNILMDYNSIGGIDPDDWDDSIVPDFNRLYRRVDSYKDKHYAYYDTDLEKWVDYQFSINFRMTYGETSVMEPKTYVYNVTLLGGVLNDGVMNVIFNKPLLGLNDFIVEGSVSE